LVLVFVGGIVLVILALGNFVCYRKRRSKAGRESQHHGMIKLGELCDTSPHMLTQLAAVEFKGEMSMNS
jgi:hypothetical protein